LVLSDYLEALWLVPLDLLRAKASGDPNLVVAGFKGGLLEQSVGRQLHVGRLRYADQLRRPRWRNGQR
jgi:hypothetical protein